MSDAIQRLRALGRQFCIDHPQVDRNEVKDLFGLACEELEDGDGPETVINRFTNGLREMIP